jgi:signal transduction histidine kinase
MGDAPVQRNRRSFFRVGPDSTWTTVVPVVFIIISLLSLVLLPIVVSRHTASMREQISSIAEPARRAANEMQIDLSAELDKVIAFQVTGQAQYARDYVRLVQDQQQNRAALQKLAPRLSGDIDQELQVLFNQTARWHEQVRGAEFMQRQLPQEVFLTRLYERHPSYERSLRAASDLEIAIQGVIEERLQRIRDVERINTSLTIILTLLALTSALLVAGLGRQMRLLAGEAMRRRHEAERDTADARKLRVVAEREERRAAFLAAAGQELSTSLDQQQTTAILVRLIVPNLADRAVIDRLDDGKAFRRIATADKQAGVTVTVHDGPIVDDVPDAITAALRERQPRLVVRSENLARYLGLADGEAPAPAIVVPMVTRGETLGVIVATAPEGKPFTSAEVALFADLVRHGSLAVDNATLYSDSQQAVRAREEVLAIVSHDLRNPLNAVTLAASLLQTSPSLSRDDREQIDTIVMSAKRMSRLIADLLDVTRLEGGKRLPIEPESVEVQSLFHEADELFKAQAAANHVRLESKIVDGVPKVHADRHRVMQVLSNLIGNSLKFTPEGGAVAFRAERRDDTVLFVVSDTGPGIPNEHLADIFHPFWQAKRAERMGAGLGLPIAKGIVESHGGRIWVESDQAQGTTFFFTLPVARSEAATPTAESAAAR